MAPPTGSDQSVLSLPVTGTDDAVLQMEMKKAYVAFVSTILSSGVQDFLISDREFALCPFPQTRPRRLILL